MRIERKTRALLIAAAALVGLLSVPAAAGADFHLVKIREIAGDTGNGHGSYIELQMYSPGQTQLAGHKITIWDAGASFGGVPGPIKEFTLAAPNPAGADNQRTILIGDTNVAGKDFTLDLDPYLDNSAPGGGITGAGAVCFEAIPVDCVSWGGAGFTDPPNLPDATTPNGGTLPTGLLALQRNIGANCPTALDAADDTDNAAADFSLVNASPTPNSATPVETPCVTALSPVSTAPFNLKAAIRKCKKKFPKGPKRKKCIKRAKRKAATA